MSCVLGVWPAYLVLCLPRGCHTSADSRFLMYVSFFFLPSAVEQSISCPLLIITVLPGRASYALLNEAEQAGESDDVDLSY